MADKFQAENGIDLRKDPMALQRLKEAAEKAKMELSSTTQTNIKLPFITADASGPKHLDYTLTRAEFERITKDLLDRCKKPVEQALKDAGLKMGEVDEVILVGGSTRMPAVQELVKQLTGKAPNMSVNPDEVVALSLIHILDFPELFRAYPELRNLRVDFYRDSKSLSLIHI